MRLFATPRELRERGVLGMNQRNADYIMRYNPRRLYPLVDNKLETKKLALESGIAVPELYGVVAIEHQVQEMASILADHQALVIKPAHGSGGNGILVIDSRMGKFFRKANGNIDGNLLRSTKLKSCYYLNYLHSDRSSNLTSFSGRTTGLTPELE